MIDTEPKYFSEFKSDFKKFEDKLYEKLDSHQEQIASVAVQVTELAEGQKKIQSDLSIMKGHMATIYVTLNKHTDILNEHTRILKPRSKKLEKYDFT